MAVGSGLISQVTGLADQVAKPKTPPADYSRTVVAAPTAVGSADNSGTAWYTAARPAATPAPAASPAPVSTPISATPSAVPGLTVQTGPTVNTAGASYAPTAYTSEVDPSKTTSGLISQVMNNNGELMRIASQEGINAANRRGMGNSSIAAQASMRSMIDAALPIAQSDAGIYQNQASNNQAAMNSAAQAANSMAASDLSMRQQQELNRMQQELGKTNLGETAISNLVGSYSDGVREILGNPAYTTDQKNAYIQKLYDQMMISASLQSGLSGIDLSGFIPASAAQAPAAQAPASGATPDQQIAYIKTQGVTDATISSAQSAGFPLVNGGGAILVGYGTGIGGMKFAVYYDEKTGKYVNKDGGSSTDYEIGRAVDPAAPWKL